MDACVVARIRVCQDEATQLFCCRVFFLTSPMSNLQKAASNAVKLEFNQILVYGMSAFGAMAAIIGIAVCIGISTNSRYAKLSHP